MYIRHVPITFTSPAAASTVVETDTWENLHVWDEFTLDAVLTGATGGTLDVYLQRRLGPNSWVDWVHLPQKADGAAATRHTISAANVSASWVVPGGGTDAAPGVALTASTITTAHPGDVVRIVAVAGAGTSAGASQSLTLTMRKSG